MPAIALRRVVRTIHSRNPLQHTSTVMRIGTPVHEYDHHPG
ncbi:hypothetical protein [Paraburkholderia rhizosphaerae]|nr:hypothetical protein [Paraburkholderia rhizosphaerae]